MISEPNEPEDKDPERIAKWRKERAAVAEQERAARVKAVEEARQERLRQAEIDKQERIRKAKEEREAEAARKVEMEKVEATALLPNERTIDQARRHLLHRHRGKRMRLMLQLILWVLLPTAFVGYYTTEFAVRLYEARSVIVVSKVGSDGNEGLGGLLGAATNQSNLREAFMAHEYVQSQALMDQLEEKLSLVTTYSSKDIDPAQRLRNIPLLGISERDHFDRFVTSSINIQSGLMHLYVRAPTAEDAVAHSTIILDLIAEQVNSLSDEMFIARIKQAQDAVAAAETTLQQSQNELTQLQIESGEVDPRARIEGVFQVIAQLQSELVTLRSEIDRAIVLGQSATYGAQRLTELELVLNERIAEQRILMVGTGKEGSTSLNRLLTDYEQALLKSRIGEQTLTAALVGLSEVREKAVLGRSEFQVVVPPRTASIPATPNPLAVVLLTFLTVLGLFSIYQLLVARKLD